MRRLRPLLGLLLMAGAALPAVALGQGQKGLFSITPARQLIVGHPPKSLGAISVSNTTKQALDVTVFPVVLTQSLNGSVTFEETPRALRVAQLQLTPSETKFTLSPGSSRKVRIRWNALPRGARAANLGVVFQSIPPQAAGQPVGSIERLLALEFLQLPGHDYRITGRFTELRTEQGPKQTLVFTPRVENTGELVTSPTGTHFSVRDSAGKLVYSTHWAGDIVLPGAQRDFPITVKKILQKGDYTATATAHFGTSRMRISRPFTLAGPNQLPTPRVAIDHLQASGTIGKDSQATARMRSVGSAPAATSVKFELFKIAGKGASGKAISTEKQKYTGLAPGSTKNLHVTYHGLGAGTYRVVLTYRDTPQTLQQITTIFQPTKEKSFWDKNKGLILGLLIGLGILLLLALLWRMLRRHRRMREELEEARAQQAAAAPVAPPPAAPEPASAEQPQVPPPAGIVNVNSATYEELQTLPGIGPKAAQRIVDHRDEYGRFSSIEDLANVEGFNAGRVDALRGKIDV